MIKKTITFTFYGSLFGMIFPIIGTTVLCMQLCDTQSLSNYLELQSVNPLLWIIDSAPFILGTAGYTIGTRQEKLDALIMGMRKEIADQTADLRKTNLSLHQEIEAKNTYEKQLIEAKEAAEQGIRSKEQFLSNMSHEIRTPMNGIIGMTEILLQTKLTKDQRNYLSAIDYSSKHLLTIINDILDLSKINAEKLDLDVATFSLEELMNSVLHTLKYKSDEKGIFLRVNLSDELPESLSGDRVRITQILLNLLGNAVKFTEKGGVTLTVALKESNDTGPVLDFTVEDTGIGIPENYMGYLFDTFSQAHSKIASKYGGTGLGLAISKRLIELYNGTIDVESKEGEGSTFHFTLQLFHPGEIMERPKHQMVTELTKEEKAETKILLAEDNKINQMVAITVLERFGFKVDVANNGKEAIDKFAFQHYDLILMDVQMPEMDGLETTEFIRHHFDSPKNEVRIVAMTASVLKTEIDHCLSCGMDDFIAKPFKADELYVKIVNLLSKKDRKRIAV